MEMYSFKTFLRKHLSFEEMNECWFEKYRYQFNALSSFEVNVSDPKLGKKIEKVSISHQDNAWSFFNYQTMKVTIAFCHEDNCNVVVNV